MIIMSNVPKEWLLKCKVALRMYAIEYIGFFSKITEINERNVRACLYFAI